MKTVYIVGGDPLVETMFRGMGYRLWDPETDDYTHDSYGTTPDLICFTGGADVSPELYGHQNTGQSYTNPRRDEREVKIYNEFVGKVPFVGICRGGQLLNVLNGGTMIQHIEGHLGTMRIHGFLEGAGSFIAGDVLVDHHQAIVPPSREFVQHIFDDDVVCTAFFPVTRSLCFQPHPEWGHEGTRKLFFQLIEEYIT